MSDMKEWLNEVLKNKIIVDNLCESQNSLDNILDQYDEQKIEEIKICADILSHEDKKYLEIIDLINNYQITNGQKPDFRKK